MQSHGDEYSSGLEAAIGYVFTDKALLREALSHKSYSNERLVGSLPSYQRLEFLGDAVLGFVAAEYLMRQYPEMPEGWLTKARAQCVCEPALAARAREIGLGEYLLLGKGEEMSGGRERDSLLADTLEALIGALYSEAGLPAARDFIERFVLAGAMDDSPFIDSKSAVFEYVAKNALGKLHYEHTGTSGPEYGKVFHVDLYLNEKKIGTGTGSSKKAAEQQAAYQVLTLLKPEIESENNVSKND
jgi:ribonuclease-3